MNENTNKNENNEATEVKYKKVFNCQKEYIEEVIPLLKKLIAVCDKYAMPYLFWVIFSHNEILTGQGVLLHSAPFIANGKMSLLGNIADNSISMEDFAEAFMAAACIAKFMGGDKDSDKKGEDK